MIKIDPVGKIGMQVNSLFKFFLGKNNYLEQFILIGFIIKKFTQDFQAKNRYLLTFVNNQNDCFFLIDTFMKQILFYAFFDLPVWFTIPLTILVLSILGNFLSAILLQSALQVYIHERQLGAGVTLMVILVIEVAHLLFRGLLFGLLGLPNQIFLPMLLGAFLFGTILVFIGSLMAIYVGNKKRKQFKEAREKLHLSLKPGIEELTSN